MKRVLLFATAILLCGLGGLGGSILGNAFGKAGLWVGGLAGGLLASVLLAWIAVRLQWAPPERMQSTALWTGIGFLLAAAIAVNTLSSPVGPILSTILAGLGALFGSRSKSAGTDV